MKRTAIIAVLGMLVVQTQADLTYVDAVESVNTTPDAAIIGDVDAADDLWRTRTFGTDGSVFEASGNSGAEDAPELATVISGLIAGESYNVWMNFYDVDNDVNQNWGIKAGFTSGALTSFANDDGGSAALGATASVLASSFTYVVDPRFDDGGNRMLEAGALGSAVADINGEITVFVDDLATGIASNYRTWYDGVSYEVVPEPATIGLIGIFGAGALFVRRRFMI